MNEKAERINGWAAMIGVIAAMDLISQPRDKLSLECGKINKQLIIRIFTYDI